MCIMQNGGGDFVDLNYPVNLNSYQPANRSPRSRSNFPVDNFDLRVHVLIGYLEEAIRRPITNQMLYEETDDNDDDDIESDDSSEEDTDDSEVESDDDKEERLSNKYKDIASFFSEKDGTQEPYEVCVRFSYSPLPDDELVSQATQTDNGYGGLKGT